MRAVRPTTLLAVEGERDKTCPPGQTRAALDLCAALGPEKKRHRLQRGAGHDDLFEGPTWATNILPLVREVIRSSD
jgi:poly(3-hydroxybutyrate) depolymerase